jgi:hypothetical protein
MPAQVPTMDEFNALDARVKALETHPPVGGPTPDGTYITKVSDPAIVDDVGNHYTLVQGSAAQALQIAKNGVTDTVTQHVVTLGIEKRKAIQKNTEGNWYQDNNNTSKTNTCAWQQTSDPHAPPIPAGSMFKIANGKFHRPDGTEFKPTGTNVWWMSITKDSTGWNQGDQVISDWNTGAPLLQCFDKVNMVRLLCFTYDWPTDEQLKPWIDFFTSKKIITLIDPHDYSGGSNWVYNYADGTLQSAIAFLSRVATTNKNNPYVWYQTENEPGTPNRDEILGLYHAVRDTGNPHPILIGWVTWGYDYRVDRDVTAGMTNVGIDVHYYDGTGANSGNIQDHFNAIHNMFNSVRSNLAQSADGEIPIGIYEFGDACCGHLDAHGQVAVQAVCESPDVRGWASFNWTTDGNYAWGHDILNQRQNPVLAGTVCKPYMTGP